jgi:pyruvate dehydrogenase E2 component (dihydrolipoamide acetyltransferase)
MITKIIMPQLSLTMRFGIVIDWYKKEGEYIKQGEPVCSIEGDKATVDIEAPASGYLKKIKAVIGEEFPVKEVIGYIGEQNEALPEEGESPKTDVTQPGNNPPKSSTTSVENTKRILATPVARRLAAEHAIDLSTIRGTGPEGMINREDILAFIKPSSTSSIKEIKIHSKIPLNRIKKIVAERTKASYLEAPHIHLSLHANMEKVIEAKDLLNKELDGIVHITFTDIFIWALSRSLIDNRILNATLNNDTIVLYSDINIGFAVATDQGLMVAVIKNVDTLPIEKIAKKREELVERLKIGHQTLEDVSGSTFTLTNLGMSEIEVFDPILTLGQAGILAVGKITTILQSDSKGEFIPQPIVNLTLACDHRIADGVEGANFMGTLKTILENPKELFSFNKPGKV